jgi:hypothetical protein
MLFKGHPYLEQENRRAVHRSNMQQRNQIVRVLQQGDRELSKLLHQQETPWTTEALLEITLAAGKAIGLTSACKNIANDIPFVRSLEARANKALRDVTERSKELNLTS